MMRSLRLLSPAVLALLCSACPSTPVSTVARVDESGALTLLAPDGRALLGFDAEPARTRTFEEEIEGFTGIWTFTREDEVESGYPTPTGHEATADGRLVARWAGDAGELSVMVEAVGEDHSRVTLTPPAGHDSVVLRLPCSGTFHGFGVQYHDTDQTGEAFDLIVTEQGIGRDRPGDPISGDRHTTYFPMPWYLNVEGGYGVLLETDARVRLDLCVSDAALATLEVVEPGPLSLSVFHGPTPLDLIRQLGDEVGRPAPVPDWAFGPWIAAQEGTEAVRADVAALRAADIPFTAIWAQDWTGVRRNLSGGFGVQYRWAADEEHYPGLRDLVDELHADDIRFLAYVNPFIDPRLDDHYPALEAAGCLLTDDTGAPYVFAAPNITSSHPDLNNPVCHDMVVDYLVTALTTWDFDGWMADFAEWTPPDAFGAGGVTGVGAHNRFPIQWHTAVREALDTVRPDGDYATIARSGWTGVQAVSQIHWIGDQEADWEETDGLPTVVPAMLNMGLAGVPITTHDIAGFSGGPSDRELFMRWVELGAFSPIFRTHDGDDRDNNWHWESDAETTEHFRRFANLHVALVPELAAAAAQAQIDSQPLVRHLMLDWPEDSASWQIHDQFTLFGTLLVAPVVEPGATERTLYLPPGTWYHLWDGTEYAGGQTVTVDAPLGQPPVFSLDADRADLRAVGLGE